LKLARILRKVLLALSLVLALLVLGTAYIFLFHSDKIVQLFLNEANKRLNTPALVDRIEFSIWRSLPDAQIIFHNFSIRESLPGSDSALLKASRVSFAIDLPQAFRNRIVIKNAKISQGELAVRIDPDGKVNYRIFKTDETEKSGRESSLLDLRLLQLEDLRLRYQDPANKTSFDVTLNSAQVNLVQQGEELRLSLRGDSRWTGLHVDDLEFLSGKSVGVNGRIHVNLQDQLYTIDQTFLSIDDGAFVVEGQIHATGKRLDLYVEGKNTSFITLLSLLPHKYSSRYQPYRSKGNVYFKSHVKGQYDLRRGLDIRVDFGSSGASFFHPRYKKGLEDATFEGSFRSGVSNSPESYMLEIRNLSCRLDRERLQGNLSLRNFRDPLLEFDVRGGADINTLINLAPGMGVKTAYGSAEVDLRGSGRIRDLEARGRMNRFNATGELILRNVSFVLDGERLPFNRFNGSFIFSNNDLAISDFTGKVGKSDFRLNGFFKNILNYLFTTSRYVDIQADLEADYIDFDELLRSNFASRDTVEHAGNPNTFRIAPELNLDFNCRVRSTRFRRFHARNIAGHLEITGRAADFEHVSMNTMGGRVDFNGTVSTVQRDRVEILTEAQLDRIDIDSVFYVFGNFGQEWIVSEHLRGQMYADTRVYLRLNPQLQLLPQSILADISTRIVNGRLIDFEPVQKLSKYIPAKALSDLRFAELENEGIRIENRMILLPPMEVRSSASNIRIGGRHSFDQKIDYRLAIPLRSLLRARQNDNLTNATQGSRILLKVEGSTDDFTVGYDTQALREKWREDFRKEGQEWKEKTGPVKDSLKQGKMPEPEEDEYFDFEDDSSGL
jgi:hypothetical protein